MRKFSLFHRRKPAESRSSLPLLETDQDGRQNARIVDYNSTNNSAQKYPSLDPMAVPSSDHRTTYDVTIPSSPNSQRDMEYTSIGNPSDSYRGGFSTSMSHLFVSPEHRVVDCCSLFCCGILQHEYNRHFLTAGHFKPRNFFQRFLWYIFIPVFAFGLASYFAVHFQDASFSPVVSTLLVLFSFGWIVYLSLKSSMRRGQFRLALIRWLKLNGNKEASMDVDITLNDGRWGDDVDRPKCITCVHRSCSFYPVDYDDERDDVDTADNSDVDFCSLSSIVGSKLCCGTLCGCWFQFCGICALAQEGRQVHKLISPQKRFVDYITFERYYEYFERIKKLRMDKDGSIFSHYQALSKLSRMLLKTLGMTTLVLFLFSVFAHYSDFQLVNLLVYLATFCQAFSILLLVHWCYHKFDLSLDAVIKYFACGFILCTSTVFFFELSESIFLQFILLLIMSSSEINYSPQGSYYRNIAFNAQRWIDMSAWDEFKLAFSMKYPVIIIVYLFLGAFLVAAFTEEVCKYFSFVICEHPDFIYESDKELLYEKSKESLSNHTNPDGPERAPSMDTVVGASQETFISSSTQNVPRTKESIGAAITVAMVAVSVGFACCENLVYIFLYNGSSATNEIAVLLARSIFPVHPLCAALQSIGVCRKVIEKEKVSLGQIIMPAVLIHGFYDFSIMVTTFLSILSGKGDSSKGNPIFLMLSFVLSFSVVIIGCLIYLISSSQQRARLRVLDASSNTSNMVV